MIQHYNPTARNFNPNGAAANSTHGNSTPLQVSPPPSPYLEARLANLETAHGDLRGEVNTLKELYHDIYKSFGKQALVDGAKPVNPPLQTNLVESRQSATHFNWELEQLSREVRESVNGDIDDQKANSSSTPKANRSVPSHARAASMASHGSGQKSVPPHLRGSKQSSAGNGNLPSKSSVDTTKHRHEPLLTDGPVDTIIRQPTVPTAIPTPPLSPTTTVQGDVPLQGVEVLSLNDWKPYYLTTLKALPANVLARIPANSQMITFKLDFLHNTLGGISWSPGLMYINSNSAPPMLRNRTYYMIDATHEPYLPKAAGEHGAKLTAFFNKAPEEEFDNFSEGTNSYTDVPMFLQVTPGRYTYFGNYSQTRWSDKLDNDTMKAHVPKEVKDHIAKDLTDVPREAWATRELKKHFFPRPDYEGAILLPASDDTTIHSVNEENHNKQVASDVKDYVQELVEWKREANMKTAMIKADFVLSAFEAADADDPPALRLWWEYLECVDWKLDFYNMLVALQARNPTYLK